jgi:hypothetical protein
MKVKYRKDRIILLGVAFLFLIITIIVFIIKVFKTKSYSLDYQIKDTSISENYDNTNKYYYYKLTYNNFSYDFIYESEYIKERKLISGIKKYYNDEYTCLIVDSDYFTINPLCSNQEELIDYHLIDEDTKEKIKKYYKTPSTTELKLNNYEIYNTEDTKVIWNYKGINIIEKDKIESVNVFKKDIYEPNISTLINNYFIVADYEQTYNYDTIYIIDIDTKEVTKWDLDTEISFDSYIIGTNDKSVYIIDKKNKIEYELVPHKQKMRKISSSNKGIIYNNGEEEKISMDRLVSQKYSFIDKNNYKFELDNKTLYMSINSSNLKTKISNKEIDSILSIKKDTIYYLIGSTIYRYNLTYGETKIMKYSELEYNNTNIIFIK